MNRHGGFVALTNVLTVTLFLSITLAITALIQHEVNDFRVHQQNFFQTIAQPYSCVALQQMLSAEFSEFRLEYTEKSFSYGNLHCFFIFD